MTSFTRDQEHSQDARPPRRRRWLRPRVLLPVGAVGAVLLTVALIAFEPWTLFIDETVSEAAPVSAAVQPDPAAEPGPAAEPDPAAAPDAEGGDASGADAPVAAPADPVTLLQGSFISHEHGTSGEARILELADGSRVLRIEGLDTSNGPDLRVWLADAPVLEGRDGWFVFDEGTHIDLGDLKGNIGDQNYAVPADADLETLRSVSIWCARFRVSFGAAALT